MSNVTITGSNFSLVQGTIGTNGTLSEQFNLAGYNSIGLLLDAAPNGTLNNGTLNFLVSYQPYQPGTLADAYRLLRDSSGAAVAYTIPAVNATAYKEIDIRVIAPYTYVRLLSTVTQAAVTATFVVKG